MVYQQSLGAKFTSLKDLINGLHKSVRYLNSYISDYVKAANPIERITALTKIVRERLRLQILVKNLGKAYLDAVERNIREISAFVLRNPQYMPQLDGALAQTEKNMKWVIEEESRERVKSDLLRKDAKRLFDKVKPTFKSVRRKIERLQKQKKLPAHELGGTLPEATKRKMEQWNRLQQAEKQKELAGKR